MRQILIVEDTESDARLLERALRTAGVANPIEFATNGADAIAYLNANQSGGESNLAIIFVDMKLPDKSGFDILKVMQGKPTFSRTLRVMASSIDDMENIRHAYSLGADSFIVKPVNQFDLKELIRSFPDRWFLVDAPSTNQPSPTPFATPPAQDPYNEAVHVWAKHREMIDTVRQTLRNLRRQINDSDETLAIIETLTEELRNEIKPSITSRPKKRPGNILL